MPSSDYHSLSDCAVRMALYILAWAIYSRDPVSMAKVKHSKIQRLLIRKGQQGSHIFLMQNAGYFKKESEENSDERSLKTFWLFVGNANLRQLFLWWELRETASPRLFLSQQHKVSHQCSTSTYSLKFIAFFRRLDLNIHIDLHWWTDGISLKLTWLQGTRLHRPTSLYHKVYSV